MAVRVPVPLAVPLGAGWGRAAPALAGPAPAPAPATLAEFHVGLSHQCTLSVALGAGVDISIHARPYERVALSALSLPHCSAEPHRSGGWIGSVDRGSSVNCPQLTLVPHGSGTHTETVGHVLPGTIVLGRDVPFPPALMAAVVLTVSPTVLSAPLPDYPSSCAGDETVAASSLQSAFAAAAHAAGVLPTRLQEALAGGAVVVRTLPNDDAKQLAQWSGKNPPVSRRVGEGGGGGRTSTSLRCSTFPRAPSRGSSRWVLGSA